MKKRTKFWIVFGSVSLGVVLNGLLCICAIGLIIYNPFLASRMINYYSNDANFFRYEATVSNFKKEDDWAAIEIESVQYFDERAPTVEGNSRWARVFSPNLNETWAAFDPEVGLRFEFVGNMKVFYDGGEGVIVSIFARGEQILAFEDGKTALLEWAKQVS